jgi:hypothetical protein
VDRHLGSVEQQEEDYIVKTGRSVSDLTDAPVGREP